MKLSHYIAALPVWLEDELQSKPWHIPAQLSSLLRQLLPTLEASHTINNEVAVHPSAIIEPGVIIKGPAIIGENCFIGAHAYIRGGVYLDNKVSIGPGCEIKSSFIHQNSAAAHFNFIGDSIIGSGVNMEAGAIIANHFNERSDKNIRLIINNNSIETDLFKFGSIVGDNTKIGANAVLSPGTILHKNSIVKRLELVEQDIQ